MSSVEEPLISHPLPASQRQPDDDDDLQDGAAAAKRTTASSSPTLFIYLLSFSAGISGLLFGCTASSPLLLH